jgi:glutaredoxin
MTDKVAAENCKEDDPSEVIMGQLERGVRWVGWLVVLLIAFAVSTGAQQLPDVLVFYRESCPQCHEMDGPLEELQRTYPRLIVSHIEESEPDASDLLWALSAKYGVFPSTYPVIFVGDEAIVGTGRPKELLLRNTVRDCMQRGCASPMEKLTGTPFSVSRMVTIAMVSLLVLTALLLLLL